MRHFDKWEQILPLKEEVQNASVTIYIKDQVELVMMLYDTRRLVGM